MMRAMPGGRAHDGGSRAALAGAAALAVAVIAVSAPARAADDALVAVPFDAIAGRLRATPSVHATPAGIEVAVDGPEYLAFPFAATGLELDVEGQGPVLLTWASLTDGSVARFGPPWRYVRVPEGASTLRLDLLATAGWTPRSQPILFLDGAGRVVVRAIRARRPWPEAERNREAYDAVQRWAPESVSHTTINFLTPSYWSVSDGIWFADVAAAVGLAALALTLGVTRLRGGRVRPRLAVAVGALAAFAVWDAQFAIRYLPMLRLGWEPDPDARVRDGYSFRPEFGALAALARTTLRPGDRVEVIAKERDWFAGQTMCFNLAPRPCVFANPGTGLRRGISGVGKLEDGEIDAVVTIRNGPLPPGFVEVGRVSPTLVVGRRP
jgi:hypothetical protein